MQSILVLDDHSAFRESLAWLLRQEHYDVQTVGNGDQAEELIRRRPFDLVITDRNHPGLHGDLIEALSKRCIVLTGDWRQGCVHKGEPAVRVLEKVKQLTLVEEGTP